MFKESILLTALKELNNDPRFTYYYEDGQAGRYSLLECEHFYEVDKRGADNLIFRIRKERDIEEVRCARNTRAYIGGAPSTVIECHRKTYSKQSGIPLIYIWVGYIAQKPYALYYHIIEKEGN